MSLVSRCLRSAAAGVLARDAVPVASLLRGVPAASAAKATRAAAPRRAVHTTTTCRAAASASASKPKFVNPYAGAAALGPDDIATIKATVPVLAEHGVTLTTRFYAKVHQKHPALKNIFNTAHQATGMQPRALAEAVYAYAANIDNLGALAQAVKLMTHKHAALSITPDMYPIVGENLLLTLGELLTEAKFPEATIKAVLAAWTKAYAQLANILIEEEERLYQAAESTPGGWRGWRKFIVTRVDLEAESGIKSFYLSPKDGGALPTFLPGQYTTIQATINEAGETYTQPRQYSLSQPSDGKHFRITVKREDAADATPAVGRCPVMKSTGGGCPVMHGPAGKVSTQLHATAKVGTEVLLAPPFGEFTLDVSARTPVVLVGAGVGVTPLASMAEAASASGRAVSFLYACDTGKAHPLKAWMGKHAAAAAGKGKFDLHVWYRCPEAGVDQKGRDFQQDGLMNIQPSQLVPNADYYICGPPAFMAAQLAALKALGVSKDRLHAEAFGTGVAMTV